MRLSNEEIRRLYFDEYLPARVLAYRAGVSRQRIHQIVCPEKYRAQRAVQYAVATGKMVRPATCEDCGCASRVEGHHEDYSRPLVVRWLCQRCHAKYWCSTMPAPPRITRDPDPCSVCGKLIVGRSPAAKTCSPDCGARRKAMVLAEFYRKKAEAPAASSD